VGSAAINSWGFGSIRIVITHGNNRRRWAPHDVWIAMNGTDLPADRLQQDRAANAFGAV
jgi:hypothetical protein